MLFVLLVSLLRKWCKIMRFHIYRFGVGVWRVCVDVGAVTPIDL